MDEVFSFNLIQLKERVDELNNEIDRRFSSGIRVDLYDLEDLVIQRSNYQRAVDELTKKVEDEQKLSEELDKISQKRWDQIVEEADFLSAMGGS